MNGMKEVEKEITAKIVELLETKGLKWIKSWSAFGFPKNVVSKKNYRGVNAILLNAIAESKGYKCPVWATFRQINDKGGSVKAGQKGSMVVYWKILEKNKRKVTDDKGNEKEVSDKVPLLKYYYVWNIEQTTLKAEDYTPKKKEISPIAVCEKVVEGYKDRPTINHGGDKAYYNFADDHIQLPHREAFNSAEEYYATAFHEMAHSTGHESRLKRDLTGFNANPDGYSKEEVIAEMTASFLCGFVGIEDKTIRNSSAYIQHFIKNLREDNKFIFKVMKESQRAFKHIVGDGEDNDSEETEGQ